MQPDTVNAALQNYDIMLRVVRREPMGWAVERKIHNTPAWKIEPLKQVLYSRANRAIPDGLPLDREAQALSRRRDARARLDAMNEGYRVLFFAPDLDDTTVNHIMGTLKATDLWAKSNHEQGREAQTADRIASDMDYEQARAEERLAAINRDENRARATEAYFHAGYKSGLRISMAR